MKNVLLYFFTIIVYALLFCMSSRTWASPIRPELESKLKEVGPSKQIPVIVSLGGKVDLSFFQAHKRHHFRPKLIKALRSTSTRTQKKLKTFLKQEGVGNIKSLWLINSMAFTAKPDTIRKLATFAEVDDIRFDYVVSLPETQYETTGQVEWNLERINAPALWSLGITGQGITVANMDSGVDVNHNDLNYRWRGGDNSWFDPYGEHSTPYDNDGHGTQTMGIIVGGDANGTAIGIAPDANWIAVKIFNDAGDANFSGIHLGFQWLLDPDDDPNTDDSPHIVNNSWGLKDNVNECVLEFYDDIEILKTAGIAVVFSAGNKGPYPNTSISPANYDNSFAVGSTDSSNSIAYGSSRGPSPCHLDVFPQVVAPGVNIKTSSLTFDGLLPNYCEYVSGTSFAAPHVSGAMALLLSAYPDLNVTQLENSLTLSSVDLGEAGPDNNYGYGLIDVNEAYEFINSVCPADFDFNGSTDLSDFMILANEWLVTDCNDDTPCQSDLNNDGQIDFHDYAKFSDQYLQPACP